MSNQIFNLSRIILKNNLHCRLLHFHPHIPIETQCRVVAFPYIQGNHTESMSQHLTVIENEDGFALIIKEGFKFLTCFSYHYIS